MGEKPASSVSSAVMKDRQTGIHQMEIKHALKSASLLPLYGNMKTLPQSAKLQWKKPNFISRNCQQEWEEFFIKEW